MPILLIFLILISSLMPVMAQSENRPNFLKDTYIVGTKTVYPFAYKDQQGQWVGISVDLWKKIAGQLGIKFEWRELLDTNALIEAVENKSVEVGIAAITMTPSRVKRLDFSDTMFKSSVGIAARKGGEGTFSLLRKLVSLQFFKAILSLAGVLGFIGVLIWLLERRKNPDEFQPSLGGLWSGFWWSAVTMTTVGYGDKSPRSVGGRLLGLVWMFASIIMISAFTAAIASSLTTAQFNSVIEGPEDLPRVRVGAKKGESPVSLLRERGVRAIEFESVEEGLNAVNQGQIDAFVHDTPILQALILADPGLAEGVLMLHRSLREERYGIAFGKPDNPDTRNKFRQAVNQVLVEFEVNGTLAEIKRQYLGN